MQNPFEEILQELHEVKQKLSELQNSAVVPDEIIDQEELCRRLNSTRPTINKAVKKGDIPRIRVGATVRFNWPKVIKALEKNSNN